MTLNMVDDTQSKILKVSEIFYSIQGESTYTGLPCIFIRLAECNLNCIYCDTKYAFVTKEMPSINAIMDRISCYPCHLVEITGGEPVLQDEVVHLMDALNQQGYEILLETNGSLYLGEIPSYVTKIVDVKTPGSGEGSSFMKWNLKFLKENDEIKFVLTSHWDFRFAIDFIKEHKLQNMKILLSPVTSVLKPKTVAKWMLDEQSGLRLRLQLQLHKIIDMQ